MVEADGSDAHWAYPLLVEKKLRLSFVPHSSTRPQRNSYCKVRFVCWVERIFVGLDHEVPFDGHSRRVKKEYLLFPILTIEYPAPLALSSEEFLLQGSICLSGVFILK